ncbi:DUF2306 domain-containing protein [Hymenobacter sp. HMF4947]|uniref:DUF2306 domain-containing protein n=1 Tax=Hymenobacter ginkgonis TaxID=2682976 RepID=A0A7K1TFP8_9BACT|nr:DUF2306 domain-containing protein [Hymenobacter ginkgonis]MVN77230.1 DUF2306 domain-containing protein [Hymenobacter ginkgonis]
MPNVVNSTLPSQVSPSGLAKLSIVTLRWAGRLLVATVWGSAGLFGLYILAFYAAALFGGHMQQWNKMLPGLYTPGSTASTSGIGLHFAAGGVILLLGSSQLLSGLRTRWPAVHRWVGRVYVLASALAAIGGLLFIGLRGTIGGPVMNVGFALYGLLTLLAAVETYRHAVAGRLAQHRAWSLRLYALAIGSWLYRMDYGFWIMATDGAGHTHGFTGLFDQIMAFFFYLPNLLVVEIYLRARSRTVAPVLKLAAAGTLLLATGFLGLGTYYFTLYYWGPAILKWLSFV